MVGVSCVHWSLNLFFGGKDFVAFNSVAKRYVSLGHNELAPTNAPWKMDGKWLGKKLILGSSTLTNHGG